MTGRLSGKESDYEERFGVCKRGKEVVVISPFQRDHQAESQFNHQRTLDLYGHLFPF